MDFKISKERGIGLRSDNSLVTPRASNSTDEARASLTKKREDLDDAALAKYGEEAASGENLVVGNIKKAIGQVKDAIEEALLFKEKEVELAQRGANLPHYTQIHDQLFSELVGYAASIQTADSISQSGAGQTYLVSLGNGEFRDAISTGRTFSQAQNRYEIRTGPAAEESIDQLKSEVVSYRANKTAYSAALAKADNLIPEEKEEVFTVKETRPNTLESVEEAQRLAKSIADQLGSAYGKEETVSKLIESSTEGLSLDRVKNLLS